jgi:hypothetical protein
MKVRSTNKIILIDNLTNEVIISSSKGALSDYINKPRETIVNWLRGKKSAHKGNYVIIRADKEISKSYPSKINKFNLFK